MGVIGFGLQALCCQYLELREVMAWSGMTTMAEVMTIAQECTRQLAWSLIRQQRICILLMRIE